MSSARKRTSASAGRERAWANDRAAHFACEHAPVKPALLDGPLKSRQHLVVVAVAVVRRERDGRAVVRSERVRAPGASRASWTSALVPPAVDREREGETHDIITHEMTPTAQTSSLTASSSVLPAPSPLRLPAAPWSPAAAAVFARSSCSTLAWMYSGLKYWTVPTTLGARIAVGPAFAVRGAGGRAAEEAERDEGIGVDRPKSQMSSVGNEPPCLRTAWVEAGSQGRQRGSARGRAGRTDVLGLLATERQRQSGVSRRRARDD